MKTKLHVLVASLLLATTGSGLATVYDVNLNSALAGGPRQTSNPQNPKL